MVQAVLILGYWHPDSTDRFEAWHWTGVAISMCQSMRMHRASLGGRSKDVLSAPKRALARRIWWCCVIRDRWLAVIRDRPMRINLEDCDLEMPTPADVADELDNIDHRIREKYFGYQSEPVGRLWCSMVGLSLTLGKVSRLHSTSSLQASAEVLSEYEKELQDLDAVGSVIKSGSMYEKFFALQVGIHHEYLSPTEEVQGHLANRHDRAVNVMLFRPFILTHPVSPAMEPSTRSEAVTKTRNAAVKINGFLEQILDLDLVENLSPSMISPLILAMQIHLLDCKSNVRSTSRLGHHRLQMCMIIQAELKDTYWGADSAFRLFEQAQNKLLKIASRRDSSTAPFSTNDADQIATQSMQIAGSFNPNEITPSIDDLLSFDLAFTEPQDLHMYGMDYV